MIKLKGFIEVTAQGLNSPLDGEFSYPGAVKISDIGAIRKGDYGTWIIASSGAPFFQVKESYDEIINLIKEQENAFIAPLGYEPIPANGGTNDC